MTDMRTVAGGCHCGAVRYEAEAGLGSTMECNCSHCEKKGLILTFTPIERFRLLSGQEKLTEYRFNTHKIAHRFCADCGVQAFGFGSGPDGQPMAAINVRSVDGIDLAALTPQKFDGRSL
jgi:hypothetical protein